MAKKIALIFDFDDTLAPDSTSSFLEDIGVDSKSFWRNEVQPLDNADWDPIPAYMFKMLELSKNEVSISQEKLADYGKRLKFHEGVMRLFSLLQNHTASISSELSLEFFIISSGVGEILRNTRIAHNFKQIFSSDFAYNEDGTILFPKKIISFSDKTRYLFQISKGILGADAYAKPYEVNRKTADNDYYIRLDQMIFVGDGLTDVPCFSLIKRFGGHTIAVYDKNKKERWGKAWDFLTDGRVTNIAPADYTKDSALTNSLMMAISNIAQRILAE